MRVAILNNEMDDNLIYWINACKKYNLPYTVIDLVEHDWLEKVKSDNYKIFLACPPGRESLYKIMYDEKIEILQNQLKRNVFPSQLEISLHENKKYLSYWLKAHEVPHPKTDVFYDIKDAMNFIESIKYPIVAKHNIGASGKGVHIFRKKKDLENYVNKIFNGGARQSWGPNLKMGNFYSRIKHVIYDPKILKRKVTIYKKTFNELQKGFLILQEYIPHEYEWRIVKIGESYFGHKKIKQGDKASGTKGIDYDVPPVDLLDFAEDLCERSQFESMAIDVFEDRNGGYLVNELQCVFGHVQSYICAKNDKPGRFQKIKGKWIFEEGIFNDNLSFNLRLETALNIYN